MDFVTIFLLLIPLIALYVRMPVEFVGGGQAAINLAIAAGASFVYLIMGLLILRWYIARQLRSARARSTEALLKLGKANNAFIYGLVALFFVDIHWLLIKESFERLCFSSEVFMVSDLLLLLPFLIPFVMFRSFTARQVMILRGLETSYQAELGRQLRTIGVLLMPQLLYLNLYRTIITDVPGMSDWFNAHPVFGFAVAGTLLFMLFVLSPYFVSLMFNRVALDQYPDGHLLAPHLRDLASRSGIGLGRVFVWLTRHRKIANAAVSGLFSRQRTVFLTDHLLDSLTLPEITAVVAHEVGHARFKHLYFNFLLAIMSGIFVIWGLVGLSPLIETQEDVGIAVVGLEIIYIVVFFGGFARRFERQADMYAAHISQAPETVASALIKLARANHSSVNRASITHPSIRSRISGLRRASRRFQGDFHRAVTRARLLNRVIAGVMLALFAGTVLVLEYLPV